MSRPAVVPSTNEQPDRRPAGPVSRDDAQPRGGLLRENAISARRPREDSPCAPNRRQNSPGRCRHSWLHHFSTTPRRGSPADSRSRERSRRHSASHESRRTLGSIPDRGRIRMTVGRRGNDGSMTLWRHLNSWALRHGFPQRGEFRARCATFSQTGGRGRLALPPCGAWCPAWCCCAGTPR